MKIQILHLMTQHDQPYGSRRMCCERCGMAEFHPDFEYYTDDESKYTKELAKENGYNLCTEVKPW